MKTRPTRYNGMNGFLGWMKTPFSGEGDLGIPNHVIKYHVEPDGYWLIGKKVENLVDYARAAWEFNKFFADIDLTCMALEVGSTKFMDWIRSMPNLPRLTELENMFVKASFEKGLDDVFTRIMRHRMELGKPDAGEWS